MIKFLVNWRAIFQAEDRKRLSRALRQAQDARSYQRILGVLLVAQGIPLQGVAAILQRHHHSVSRWVNRYLAQCQTKALEDAPRPGRPVATGTLTASKLRRELKRNPLKAGYPRTSWTVDLLACHLSRKYHSTFPPRTLRRRLEGMENPLEASTLPFLPKSCPFATKKGAIIRRLKRRPSHAVVLALDETLWRLFPILRCTWAPMGEEALVPISGRNAKRVLFGAINLKTGHCLLMPSRTQSQEAVALFLHQIRKAYRGRSIFLLLDEQSSHTALGTLKLAERLGVQLIWLPKQWPELNPMDHVWKDLKKDMAANYQYRDVDQGIRYAIRYIRSLSRYQLLRKAGLLSKDCWLRKM